jgi:YVTN family beta-propeller protein
MTARRFFALIPLALALGVTAVQGQTVGKRPTVRILQTSAAGDDIHMIDPETQKVVDVIRGITMPHGATQMPDGSAFYFSNEADRTLDVVSVKTLQVTKKIGLTGRPNNVAITPDGSKVYVAIRYGSPSVDVVDTRTNTLTKSIPTLGTVHNVYVTPDGRWAVAGMIDARTLTVIDTKTDMPVWSLHMEGGVRPMAFEQNPDGSTRRIFVQNSDFHGFYAVDFATRQVVQKVNLPELSLTLVDDDALQGSPAHGFAISPDGRTLWSTSKPNDRLYAFSLPDLKLVGEVPVGRHPDWLTFTPDGRFLYSANAGSNDVSVVDAPAMREVARIPVGQVPKRNYTAVIP